ncbi:MAG: DNA polymerase III subunit alpha [Kineosporiaceae bacterium]|nr:DNA polymerase III subunit alpha [Kineosporiaceae bacterium]
MPFTHLHVASGYSLRYGASTPATLVELAAEHGMSALALTDRDGLYGAVKFAQACQRMGLDPVLGVDLAVEPVRPQLGVPPRRNGSSAAPVTRRRTPVRGGAEVDPRHPRVTVLALGADARQGRFSGEGWARLCRLVSATHLRGERGRPVSTAGLIAEHARLASPATVLTAPAALTVLLGPDSEVGRAVLARRLDLARAVLDQWVAVLPAGGLAVEVVCHDGPPQTPGSLTHAARMLALARDAGLPAVLSNAVRHATPDGAITVDVLDAARRLVPLGTRHLDRTTTQGHLASPAEMTALAARIAQAAGEPDAGARLLADTRALARRCRLDPRADLGIGSVHFPETHLLGLGPAENPLAALYKRCDAAISQHYRGAGTDLLHTVTDRLEAELATIEALGYASYFLTVAMVCDDIRGIGVRVAARGSGAGSLVNHLLGISGVDPIRHNLLMERFLSPLRAQLPDIDIDVESARRDEVYAEILDRFGAERVSCVSMMDTYRVRHAIRDAGAALGMPQAEIATIATAFPHIRARDVRDALTELPELRAAGLDSSRLDLLFDLVERLDGLPRHVALHPCGVLLSDAGLLDRTPVEASWQGLPMSQFDKEDVEELGLLKLDVLGIRMQSAMAYALREVDRVDHDRIELDAVPLDDEPTYRMIRTAHTLGCFQIESPGQRELIGRFGPQTFTDIVIDISLFRPGPVKSDMINPFLRARQGWDQVSYLHPDLEEALHETSGVVVFHEQVLQIVSRIAGCSLAEADEVRRAMGSRDGQGHVKEWFVPKALSRGYDEATVTRIWQVLEAFASFGFCRAHAAAFALPTYQSAWLKTHHPAAFLAGVLTHDPGMYPKRLILDDARNLGIAVLPLDVNASEDTYRVERVDPDDAPHPGQDLPDGRGYGIRLPLTEVKGIAQAEVSRIIAARPYATLADFWHRAATSRPVVERLVLAGAFDSLYGLGTALPIRRRDRLTRRDLLLQVAELDRWSRSVRRSTAAAGNGRAVRSATASLDVAAANAPSVPGRGSPFSQRPDAVRAAAASQSRAPRRAPAVADHEVQLTLDLGDAPNQTRPTGLPEMTSAERTRAELEILGLDVSRHVLDFYTPLLTELGVTRSRDLLSRRSRAELLIAGVKVATQTPPIRSGRRVVFLTLDDTTGPVDATFFEDVQGPYAATVFHSWLLVVRGVLRRTGHRGVSLRATGAWELPVLWDAWTEGGLVAVEQLMATPDSAGAPAGENADREGFRPPAVAFGGGFVRTAEQEWEAAAASDAATGLPSGDRDPRIGGRRERAGGMGGGTAHLRRILVHPTGYVQSPYADLQTPGIEVRDTRRVVAAEDGDVTPEARTASGRSTPNRKLWHSSPGSSGR